MMGGMELAAILILVALVFLVGSGFMTAGFFAGGYGVSWGQAMEPTPDGHRSRANRLTLIGAAINSAAAVLGLLAFALMK
jgi:hypothetical protein